MNWAFPKKSELRKYAYYGIGKYIGSMLPKEKNFIEECFARHLIDTVVGTDALSLGVNFPIENVVFADLQRGRERYIISKNMFEQLARSCGKKGLL